MINTINNRVYNAEERWRLWEELEALQAARDAELDATDGIEDHTEWHEAGVDICERYDPLILKAMRRCFYAQFPKCRNEWFAKVVEGFKKGESIPISEKQFYAFKKYAGHEDCDTWRNYTTHCRVGNYGVSLTWRNANRSIKVTEL